MNLELQAYAKEAISFNSSRCLHKKLFYYNYIDQNSRFTEIGYRQRRKGYTFLNFE